MPTGWHSRLARSRTSPNRSRPAIFQALKRRHVYGATGNIIADVRYGTHLMGDEFPPAEAPTLEVKLSGTADLQCVDLVKNSPCVYTSAPGSREPDFTWTDRNSKPGVSDHDVGGQHDDGGIVWVTPLSIERPHGAGRQRFASRVGRGGFTAIAAALERDFRFSARRRRHRLKTRQRRGR